METVSVRVRDCACPGTPHGEEGDLVFLAATPSLTCGLAAQADLVQAAGNASLLSQAWLVTYVRHGAVGWNLVNGTGEAKPFDLEVLLADYAMALPVAEKADELYSPVIWRPLAARLNGSSRNGQMAASTSRNRQSMRKQRRSLSPAASDGPLSEGLTG